MKFLEAINLDTKKQRIIIKKKTFAENRAVTSRKIKTRPLLNTIKPKFIDVLSWIKESVRNFVSEEGINMIKKSFLSTGIVIDPNMEENRIIRKLEEKASIQDNKICEITYDKS